MNRSIGMCSIKPGHRLTSYSCLPLKPCSMFRLWHECQTGNYKFCNKHRLVITVISAGHELDSLRSHAFIKYLILGELSDVLNELLPEFVPIGIGLNTNATTKASCITADVPPFFPKPRYFQLRACVNIHTHVWFMVKTIGVFIYRRLFFVFIPIPLCCLFLK